MNANDSTGSADASMLHAVAMKRPARRQVSTFVGPSASDLSAQAARGEYNIWHEKPTKFRQQRAPAKTRVNVALDSGTTNGNTNPAAYICALFAKGCCHHGAECRFLHRVPSPKDLDKLSLAHDIFGRERHATNRTDMSGVGTWSRENQRTLYVGKLGPGTGDETIRSCFSEFGTIESVRVFAARGFAFITYTHRGSAEFAYMAMMDQPLGKSPMINVRWAEDDKNPRATKRKAAQTASTVEHRVRLRHAQSLEVTPHQGLDLAEMKSDDAGLEARLNALRGGAAASSAHADATDLAYPDTDNQYRNATNVGEIDRTASYPDTDDQYKHAAGAHLGQQLALKPTPGSGFNVAASVAAHLEAVKDNGSSSSALVGLGGYESSSDEDDGR